MGRVTRCAGATAVAALAWGVWTSPAGADVIDPPGACAGSGTWQEGLEEGGSFTETSGDHERSDVIEIPQADTVTWEGSVGGAELGAEVPRRDISGEVEIALPFSSVTIDSWDGSSVRAANTGDHDYDLPAFVIGIEMTLSGEHREEGLTCTGEVTVVVEGDPMENPLAFVGIAGIIVFLASLLFSGFAKFTPAAPTFEDVNPG